MPLQIIPFKSSINTCYIIKDRGTIMIDGAWFRSTAPFLDLLNRSGITPEELRLLVLTHGDFDHVGGSREIKRVTGADIAIHENDRDLLEKGIFNWPGGVTSWGRISHAIFKPVVKQIRNFPAVKADLVLGDNDQSLEEFGIQGKIIYTPGHTSGSVSVLLDSGEAFIGCLAHNMFPFVLRPAPPIYADDIDLLKLNLRKIIDRGAKILYPGHGKPFTAKKIMKYLH